MEQADDRRVAAAVDRLISQKTENIFLSLYSDTREQADYGRPA